MRRTIIVLLLVALALTQAWEGSSRLGHHAQAQSGVPRGVDSQYLIVPGERVGKWSLGLSAEAYGLGKPFDRWSEVSGGIAYVDTLAFSGGPQGPTVLHSICQVDGLAFAIDIHRATNVPQDQQTEAFKYRTAEGISIGMDEKDILRILGSPPNTSGWKERHGNLEIDVRELKYPGFSVAVNRADGRVFRVGVVSKRGWDGCRVAVVGPAMGRDHEASVFLPQYGVPIPKVLRTIAPEPNVPADRQQYLGKWFGKWGNRDPHILVVEEIKFNPSSAVAVYAWSLNGGGVVGWRRLRGGFVEGKLTFRIDLRYYPVYVTYGLPSNDTLDATYEFRGEGSYPPFTIAARMQRIRD